MFGWTFDIFLIDLLTGIVSRNNLRILEGRSCSFNRFEIFLEFKTSIQVSINQKPLQCLVQIVFPINVLWHFSRLSDCLINFAVIQKH